MEQGLSGDLPILMIGPAVLGIAAALSLVFGKTLSLWPRDGRFLDTRSSEPVAFWASGAFYLVMAVVSGIGAFVSRSSHAASAALTQEPGLIISAVVLGIGLNGAYYWLKSRRVGRDAWRRFWFTATTAGGTWVYAPELFYLQVPNPIWKVAAIPIGAALISRLLAAMNRPPMTD